MVIKQDKSKVMLFNTSKKYDFSSQITTKDGLTLEVVEEAMLLNKNRNKTIRKSSENSMFYNIGGGL